eukprot:Tamp_36347.p1 GENE.Tamp_36347~~Tamp_36347.p1  ORF type:complete len:139 (-),score=2.87 Tamp_36347:22-438(-)
MDDSGDAGVQEETEASGRSERCESCAKALRLLYAYTQIPSDSLSVRIRRKQVNGDGAPAFILRHILSSKSPLSAALAVGYVHSFCAVAGLISLIAGQKPRWYILHSHIRNVLVVFAYYLCDGCESKVCFGFVCVCGLG